MNTQLFHDLAASEEASGYTENARTLRAVPGIIEALKWITESAPHLDGVKGTSSARYWYSQSTMNAARAALAALDATEKGTEA